MTDKEVFKSMRDDIVEAKSRLEVQTSQHGVAALTTALTQANAALLHAHDGALGALALAAGVAVENEAALEVRLHHLHEGMMDDAILKRWGLNQA